MGKENKYNTLEEYLNLIKGSLFCFAFHVIYNPYSQKLETFNYITKEDKELAFGLVELEFYGDVNGDVKKVFGGNGNEQI